MLKYFTKSLKLSSKIIFNVFSTSVVPKAFYSCATWCTVMQSKSLLQKLQVFINDCARNVTKCNKTTPIPLLLSLAQIPTISQLITHHTLAKVNLQLHKPNSFLLKVLNSPFPTRTIRLIKQLIDSNAIPFNISPLSFSVTDMQNIVIDTFFDKFQSVLPNQPVFFSDGSHHFQEPRGSGASFVLYKGGSFISPLFFQPIKLDCNTTNNMAEAVAIFSIISSLHKITFKSSLPFSFNMTVAFLFENNSTCHIYSDSLICLKSLLSPTKSFDPHIFNSILHLIAALPYRFHFHHIPSHQAYAGNELADAWAKYASISTQLTTYYDHNFSSVFKIKLLLKKRYINVLASNWNEISNQKPYLQLIFPSFNSLNRFIINSSKFHFINNFITLHLPTNALLHRIGFVDSAECSHCHVVDSVEHLLFSCEKFSTHRLQLLGKLQLQEQSIGDLFLCFKNNELEKIQALDIFLQNTIYLS
jgi:ribonuclease HI